MSGDQIIFQGGGQRPQEQDAIATTSALQRALSWALRDAQQARGDGYLERFFDQENAKIESDYTLEVPGMPPELQEMRQRMKVAAQKALREAVDSARKFPNGTP